MVERPPLTNNYLYWLYIHNYMFFKKLFKRKKLTKKQKIKLSRKVKVYFAMELGFFLGIIFILMFLSVRAPFSTIDFLSNVFSNSIYDGVVVSHIDDNITLEISELCGIFPDSEEQVECVMQQINFIYNYTKSHEDMKLINSPDEYVERGGVCRDIVILQKGIFIRMGWFANYRHPIPNHVTLSIMREIKCINKENRSCWTYCDIDGRYYECY